MNNPYRLVPEWASQEAIILAWPDRHTDWALWLNEVRKVYLDIIHALNKNGVGVILLISEESISQCKTILPYQANVMFVSAHYNDTWVRDYAFLTCSNKLVMQPVEYLFNGWGQKFDAQKDNLVNQKVLSELCIQPIKSIDIVLEGGAIEIDSEGALMSTEFCLRNPKRNGNMSNGQYLQYFQRDLGATKAIIFENGHLEGDDTDGHIDTLVRFTPNQSLVVQTAFNRPDDHHFDNLQALSKEVQTAFPDHQIFKLPLPVVKAENGDRLPASYANFLISNQQVLCPVYQQPEDEQALQVIQEAYPSYKITPINCLPLVQQFGSLHCISMQIPTGTLKPEIVKQLTTGVSVHERKAHA